MFGYFRSTAGSVLLAALIGACSPGWDDGATVDSGAAATATEHDGASANSPPHDAGDAALRSPGPVDNLPASDGAASKNPVLDAALPANDAAAEPDATAPVTTPPTMAELCSACDTRAACTVVSGQAACKCPEHYLGDGKTCAFDSNCSTLHCDANSTCTAVELTNTLSCDCKTGYTKEPQSNACGDFNECTAPTGDPCATNATMPYCMNTDGSWYCSCTPKAKAKNLVVNGDFATALDPWAARYGATTVQWSNGVANLQVPAPGPADPVKNAVYNDLLQSVAVQPGATYKLTAQVSTSAVAGVYACSFGARAAGTPTNFCFSGIDIGVSNLVVSLDTCKVPANINSLQVFIGCWSTPDGLSGESLTVDNVSLVQTDGVGLCAN
ncbi:MAG: uncharacterized protein JWN04_6217 [Myxococcaceae bacterium]|nr:uncharacterized protein [Myxococcaceae bacterium]